MLEKLANENQVLTIPQLYEPLFEPSSVPLAGIFHGKLTSFRNFAVSDLVIGNQTAGTGMVEHIEVGVWALVVRHRLSST